MRLLLWLVPLLLQRATSVGPSAAGRQARSRHRWRGRWASLRPGRRCLRCPLDDGGRTFTEPIRVAQSAHLSLGLRRGPRIAMTGSAIVIIGIVGERGNGAVTRALLAGRVGQCPRAIAAP
jgi:hypothetical protein